MTHVVLPGSSEAAVGNPQHTERTIRRAVRSHSGEDMRENGWRRKVRGHGAPDLPFPCRGGRFELPTSCSQSRRAAKLRYAPYLPAETVTESTQVMITTGLD